MKPRNAVNSASAVVVAPKEEEVAAAAKEFITIDLEKKAALMTVVTSLAYINPVYKMSIEEQIIDNQSCIT